MPVDQTVAHLQTEIHPPAVALEKVQHPLQQQLYRKAKRD